MTTATKIVVGLAAIAVGGVILWLMTPPRSASSQNVRAPATRLQATVLVDQPSGTGQGRVPIEAASLIIRTIDVEAQPVSGVDLSLVEADETRSLGQTDSAGRLQVPAPDTLAGVLLAEAEKVMTTAIPLPQPVPSEVIVTLRPGAAMRGVVVHAAGEPAGAGITVLAWPHGVVPTRQELERALISRTAIRMTKTDADGLFELTGLDPLRKYTVMAGATGLATRAPTENVLPGQSGVVLTLHNICGVLLRLRAAGGSNLRTLPGLFAERPFTIDKRRRNPEGKSTSLPGAAPGGRILFSDSVSAWLAGVHRSGSAAWVLSQSERDAGFRAQEFLAETPSDRRMMDHDRLLLFAADAGIEVVGPIPVLIHVPGYRPLEVELMAPPVKPSCRIEEVTLEPVATGWGSLHISFDPVPAALQARSISRPYAWMHLRSDYLYRTPLWAMQDTRIEDIPYGDYEVTYVSAQGSFNHPPYGSPSARVSIGPTPAMFHVSLPPLGAMELVILEPDGRPYLGGLQMEIRYRWYGESQGKVAWWEFPINLYFAGPPFRLEPLHAAEHKLGVRYPFIHGSTLSDVTYAIAPNAATRLEIPWPQ